MQINIFSGHDSVLYPTLNAFNLRPFGLTEAENASMSWCSSMWPTYSDQLRIELLEKIDDSKYGNASRHSSNSINGGFPIIESDSVDCEEKNNKTKFYIRFIYGDGNHPDIAPFGAKYLITPANACKFIWENEATLLRFNKQIEVDIRDTISIFEKYSICQKKGFLGLPGEDPILKLPNDRFKAWDELVVEIPVLLQQQSNIFREKIHSLEVLNHVELQTMAELRRGYLLLTVLANVYLFGFEDENPPSIIPKSIAIPLCGISERLKIVPALIHASICLYNYKRIDPNHGYNVDNFDTIVNFMGSKDEKWFFLLTADIEFQGSKLLAPAVYLTKGLMASSELLLIQQKNVPDKIGDREEFFRLLELWISYMTFQLISIAKAIQKMIQSFKRMKEGCNPRIFYNYVRPFLAGSKNPCMPNGVIYDGVYNNEPQKYSGGSAAQSTLFPVLDGIFGVSHDAIPGPNSFLKEMQRFYMPHEHSNFILYLLNHRKKISILTFIAAVDNIGITTSSSFVHTFSIFKKRYNFCIQELTNFRSEHINVVASYIISQAAKVRKLAANEKHGEHDADSNGGSTNKKRKLHEAAGGKGTGGSDLMNFLKPIRDNTKTHHV